MNSSTIIGIVASLFLLVGSIFISSDQFVVYLNLPGFFIVITGTLAATFISYPLSELLTAKQTVSQVMKKEQDKVPELVSEIVTVAKLSMQYKVSKIEDHLDRVTNPFLRTGIQLVIDGATIEDITSLLQWRISRLQAQEQTITEIFHNMASFAPAFGMFGTLIGLVNMLFSIESGDVGQIAHHMSVALMTTLYGIILANLVFRPIALKLERRTEKRVMLMNMALEGVLLLKEQRSPSIVRQTLESFAADYEDELSDTPIGFAPAARSIQSNEQP
jgi:chemotaxis protein MotA